MTRPLVITRRGLVGGIITLPLFGMGYATTGCASKPPETPLAHLYGKEWVHGTYELYAKRYADVQAASESSCTNAYRILAQRGVTALDGLQTREVPFFIRVQSGDQAFSIERNVPDRLKFTADMSDDDRAQATARWNKARETIQTDYEEIRKLDSSLTQLLMQLRNVRNAIEEGRVEQYRIVSQLDALTKDPTQLPYELPYQVTAKDYQTNLTLLLERLDDDRSRLQAIEADIIAVGMTVRTTDAGSATLAASIRKVLLAVVEDGKEPPRDAAYPQSDDERARLVAKGQQIHDTIAQSPEFVRWQKDEQEKKFAAIGSFLQVLDQMSGLPTSAVYRTVIDVWKGDRDYLTYVKTILQVVPHGKEVAKVLNQAIEYTETARKIGATAVAMYKQGMPSKDQLTDMAKSEAMAREDQLLAKAKGGGGLVNLGSRFAMDRMDKQLSFFKDRGEVDKVAGMLGETDLVQKGMKDVTAAVPLPGG